MAIMINAKGTSVPHFTIGKNGVTLYQGNIDPSLIYTLQTGDYWFDSTDNSMNVWSSAYGIWQTPISKNSIPTVISENTLAVPGGNYEVDTRNGPITLTMPASPTVGTVVKITDYANTFDTNNLTVDGNGNNVMFVTTGQTFNASTFSLVFVNSEKGWSIQR
jgi:hypothetical protein